MCLWVIRETSPCGPDILCNEKECEQSEFNALKSTKKINLPQSFRSVEGWKGLFHIGTTRQRAQSHREVCSLKWTCNGRVFIFSSFFFFGVVWPTPPGGRTSGRLGRASWETSVVLLTDFTWPDWAVAPLHMLQSPRQRPEGNHLLASKLLTPTHNYMQGATPPHPSPSHSSTSTSPQTHPFQNVIKWNRITQHAFSSRRKDCGWRLDSLHLAWRAEMH